MKFFADTAQIDEIKSLQKKGFLDGVTTNPSLIMKSGRDISKTIAEICSITTGPVSAEVVAHDVDDMIAEGLHLAGIAENVVVKVPLTENGLEACRHFRSREIAVNVTLCFSVSQALLAAKAGATYISPFVGRLDDTNIAGIELIRDIRKLYDNYGFETKILAASVRTVNHISEAGLAGSDYATLPPALFGKLFHHPLTKAGLAQFDADWRASGGRIL